MKNVPVTSRRFIIACLMVAGTAFHEAFGFELSPQSIEWMTMLMLAWIGADSIRKTAKSGLGKVGSLLQSWRFQLFGVGVIGVLGIELIGLEKFDQGSIQTAILGLCVLIVGDSLDAIPKKQENQSEP